MKLCHTAIFHAYTFSKLRNLHPKNWTLFIKVLQRSLYWWQKLFPNTRLLFQSHRERKKGMLLTLSSRRKEEKLLSSCQVFKHYSVAARKQRLEPFFFPSLEPSGTQIGRRLKVTYQNIFTISDRFQTLSKYLSFFFTFEIKKLVNLLSHRMTQKKAFENSKVHDICNCTFFTICYNKEHKKRKKGAKKENWEIC